MVVIYLPCLQQELVYRFQMERKLFLVMAMILKFTMMVLIVIYKIVVQVT